MDYNEIIKVLAPCGLNCTKCLAYTSGDIKENASELKRLLGAFDNYADRFSRFNLAFENYPSFKKLLEYPSQLQGMSRWGLCIPELRCCFLLQREGDRFLFSVRRVSLRENHFDPNLKERWVKMNNLMKQKGVETYFEESKEFPRYV